LCFCAFALLLQGEELDLVEFLVDTKVSAAEGIDQLMVAKMLQMGIRADVSKRLSLEGYMGWTCHWHRNGPEFLASWRPWRSW
jgi:hypothetical protein